MRYLYIAKKQILTADTYLQILLNIIKNLNYLQMPIKKATDRSTVDQTETNRRDLSDRI